ncbi:MAG: 50S ribosomal protein L25/general stress protein Ctc [Syntrophobacteraceae bacterium]
MDVELSASVRNQGGKGFSRSLRRQDLVPAVLYGPKTPPVSLSLSALRLEKLLRDLGEESKLLRLSVEDGDKTETKDVLIREVQVHPYRRRFLHVDFYEVPLDRSIVVEVPVELTGESIGVKKGGVLNLIRRTVSVKCLPGEIPERVPVDISGMDLGATVHVGDLVPRVSCELASDRALAIATVTAPEGKSKEGKGGEG